MSALQRLVLASASPRRVALLQQAGIDPDRVLAADVDETPLRSEHPRALAKRLSRAKADRALAVLSAESGFAGCYVVAADTVVGVGRRILPKPRTSDEAQACLDLLSGRAHRVYSGVCVVTPTGRFRQRLVETRLRFKRLSRDETAAYLASGEWRGKAGGYAIQGFAGTFVIDLVGSYTNVVGLPLYETVSLLAGEGFDMLTAWRSGGLS